jgi:PAS domain S-box-containing protein
MMIKTSDETEDLKKLLKQEKCKSRQLKKALRESEEKYREIFEIITDIHFSASPEGKIIDISPSVVNSFPYRREDLIGKSLPDFFLKSSERSAFLSQLGDDSRIADFEFQSEGSDRRIRHYRISASHKPRRGRQKIRVTGLIRDVTAQKESEAELEKSRAQLNQAQKMEALGTLVAGVAHEINNPINLIIYNTPLLQKVWSDLLPVLKAHVDETPHRKYGGLTADFLEQNLLQLIGDIDMAAGRVAKIVTDLKNFARLSGAAEKQPVSVNEAVSNAMRLVHTTVRNAGVTIETQLTEDLPLISGNLQNIEQIVVNILINAVQAIDHSQGRIRIETGIRPADGRLHLSIADNGKGVDPVLIERLFDPFVTDKQTRGGTGLGLSVSYNLVKSHGGDINFESNPGKGTIFHIDFPTLVTGKPAKILIVDDDPVIRRMLSRALTSRCAYLVDEAANGIEACLKLGACRPDLLVLDIFMPDMDGVEVCRALKKNPALAEVNVIVTTGHPQHPKLAEVNRLGFKNIRSKPYNVSELIEFIDNILTA